MNQGLLRRVSPIILAFAAGVAVTAGLLTLRPAEAQTGLEEVAKATIIQYGMRGFAEGANILTSESSFEQVYPFPDMPVFVVRNSNQFVVTEVRGDSLNILANIPVGENFRELTFLGDKSTFLLRNGTQVRVFTVDRFTRTIAPVKPPSR